MAKRWVRLGSLVAAALLTVTFTPAAHAAPPRDVMFVGNNWDGTVDLVDARTFEKYQRIDVVPDFEQRKREMTPDRLVAMLVIRQTAGEGHDQLVDDIMVSPDGRTMYVSRPSLGDVSAFDVATGEQLWFTRVDGYRSDHMALSPDGRTLLVSATTANVVNAVDTATGAITGRIASGDFPHENRFSEDGSTIYNATIGNVVAPDAPLLDAAKGRRWLTIADARTLEVRKVIDFGVGIRPFVVLPDNRTMYAQLSFHNGFIEYDLEEERTTRTVHLPLSEEAKQLRRDEYPLDSAHHGLATNDDHTKICDAGTISDYAAILSVPALTVDAIVPTGRKPYWAATSPDGRYCFLSNSDSDDISVVSFDNPRELARIPVGDHPQRVRGYSVPADVLAS
ncbi:YncE family protein [Prauserella flavalba]|uniref:Serine/threonine protein kinase n=1 Tax=Prauserella flavalba TaxID=1477506 RepID=A0A318LK44_9PSEU|nr:beta-propeller fold lactonase family protein [Prauserella flavalba]PXY24065.1 serine/threonine protein kinase [Prauserella flavalba]